MESFLGSAGVTKNNHSIVEEEDFEVGWVAGRIENSILVRTIYGLIASSGITGNALVCFVLLRVHALRTRTSQFIINLAINDLVTCIFVIPFHLFPNLPPAPSGLAGELYCRLFISKAIMWASIFASGCSLIAVITERYCAVVHPIRYKFYFNTRLTFTVVIVCWVLALLLASYHSSFKPVNGICILVPVSTPLGKTMFGIFLFFVMYTLPILVNLVLHSRAIISLRNQAKSMDNGHPQRDTEAGVIRDRWQLRAANEMQKTLLVVVLFFLICWGPNHFLFLAYTLGARIDFTSQYYHFTIIIALFNSCVNPFIYVFKNKAFRRGIIKAFRCPTERAAVHPASGSGNGTGAATGTTGISGPTAGTGSTTT